MFGFTRQEKSVIIFLIITFTIGTGIITIRKLSYRDAADQFKSRYSELDKEFSEISKNDSLLIIQKEQRENQTIDLKININTAGEGELMKLPGIGTVLSKRIINYRNSEGKFKEVSEIVKIKGIGKKKFEKILPHIYIESKDKKPKIE